MSRVRKNVEVWKGVIERQGEEVEGDSGRRLLGFNAKRELQVMHTNFN